MWGNLPSKDYFLHPTSQNKLVVTSSKQGSEQGNAPMCGYKCNELTWTNVTQRSYNRSKPTLDCQHLPTIRVFPPTSPNLWWIPPRLSSSGSPPVLHDSRPCNPPGCSEWWRPEGNRILVQKCSQKMFLVVKKPCSNQPFAEQFKHYSELSWQVEMYMEIYHWLVIGPPLWKLEFVNWDDEIPKISGKIKLMATKPPTSQTNIRFNWIGLRENLHRKPWFVTIKFKKGFPVSMFPSSIILWNM